MSSHLTDEDIALFRAKCNEMAQTLAVFSARLDRSLAQPMNQPAATLRSLAGVLDVGIGVVRQLSLKLATAEQLARCMGHNL
jgi:hypothetical protein